MNLYANTIKHFAAESGINVEPFELPVIVDMTPEAKHYLHARMRQIIPNYDGWNKQAIELEVMKACDPDVCLGYEGVYEVHGYTTRYGTPYTIVFNVEDFILE